jgi:tetratricopeptide (TPR) repeat protein
VPTPTPKFQRLDQQNTQLIQQQVQQIKAQKLSPEAETIAIAHFYRAYDLNAEAIALLEGLVNQGQSKVVIYKLLGESYRKVGLDKESQAAYLQALTLAQQIQDVAAQAEIQYQLGDMQLDLNNLPEAKKLMLQAKKSYQDLGDSAKIQAIDQLIQEIGTN